MNPYVVHEPLSPLGVLFVLKASDYTISVNPTPYTPNPSTLHRKPLNSKPYTLNP